MSIGTTTDDLEWPWMAISSASCAISAVAELLVITCECSVVMCSVVSVRVFVCPVQALTSECLDLQTRFSVHGYILRLSRSRSNTKVIRPRCKVKVTPDRKGPTSVCLWLSCSVVHGDQGIQWNPWESHVDGSWCCGLWGRKQILWDPRGKAV